MDDDLANLLRNHMVKYESSEFLPEQTLEGIITKDCIQKVLQDEQQERYLDRILEDFRKVFAILVLCEKPHRIIELIDAEVCDEDLPLVECSAEGLPFSSMARNNEPSKLLQVFDAWKPTHRDSFFKYQHMINVPYLRPGPQPNFTSHTVIPWTSYSYYAYHNGITLYEGVMHPDYHSFHAELKQHDAKHFIAAEVKERKDNLKKVVLRTSRKLHLPLLLTWIQGEYKYFLFPYTKSIDQLRVTS